MGMTRQASFWPRGGGMGATTGSPERLLAYHPIVLGDQVIVGDGTRVFAFNLNDRPGDSESACPGRSSPPGNTTPRTGPRVLRHVSPHGDSAAHAHGRGPSGLRSDGCDERGLHAQGWRGAVRARSSHSTGTRRESCSGRSSQPRSIYRTGVATGMAAIGRSASRGPRSPTHRTCMLRSPIAARRPRPTSSVSMPTPGQPLDPLPGGRVAGRRQLFWHADAVRWYDRVERFQPSAAVA